MTERLLQTAAQGTRTLPISNSAGLWALFQFERQKLQQRLNLRWKLHRDPGAWNDPLPHAIMSRRPDGSETQLIGRITEGEAPGEFTVTVIPPEWDGHPNYYLTRLGRFHA